MFDLTYTMPSEIKGTIRVKKPIYWLGPVTDIDGRRWDVRGIIGHYVQAVPMSELHPYYTDTSGSSFGMVSQTWEPYLVEVIK